MVNYFQKLYDYDNEFRYADFFRVEHIDDKFRIVGTNISIFGNKTILNSEGYVFSNEHTLDIKLNAQTWTDSLDKGREITNEEFSIVLNNVKKIINNI